MFYFIRHSSWKMKGADKCYIISLWSFSRKLKILGDAANNDRFHRNDLNLEIRPSEHLHPIFGTTNRILKIDRVNGPLGYATRFNMWFLFAESESVMQAEFSLSNVMFAMHSRCNSTSWNKRLNCVTRLLSNQVSLYYFPTAQQVSFQHLILICWTVCLLLSSLVNLHYGIKSQGVDQKKLCPSEGTNVSAVFNAEKQENSSSTDDGFALVLLTNNSLHTKLQQLT